MRAIVVCMRGQEREFSVQPEARKIQEREAVLALIDGDFASSHRPSIEQRYEGTDVDRMLRAPFATVEESVVDFSHSFFNALGDLSKDSVRYQQRTADRPFLVMLFNRPSWYLQFVKEHITRTVPPTPMEYEGDNCILFYLSAVEKLTYLLLFIQTSSVRAAFAQEVEYPLLYRTYTKPTDEAAHKLWLHRDVIKSSMRVMLLPFTRWLRVGKHRFDAACPLVDDRAYIPITEDNCALTRPFGRIFDPLISIEIIQAHMYDQDKRFAIAKDAYTYGPSSQKVKAHYIVLVILFMYYRFACWRAEEKISIPMICTFPRFIRLAMQALLSKDFEGFIMPKGLEVTKCVLKELRSVFKRGDIDSVQLKFHDYYQKKVGAINPNRVMMGMLQIAAVLSDREASAKEYSHGDAVWSYTPMQVLTAKQIEELLLNGSPVSSAVREGVLIENCNSDLLKKVLKPFADSLEEFEDVPDAPKWEVEFVKVMHPVHTRSEVRTLALTKNMRQLKIYLYAACLNGSTAAIEMQAIVMYAGALMSGGLQLFHWLHAFRCLLHPVRAVSALHLDLVDEEKDDSNKAMLERMLLLVNPAFLRALYDQAAVTARPGDEALPPDQRYGQVKYLLRHIPMLMSKEIGVTPRGFWRLNLLDAEFFPEFVSSGSQWKEWTEERQNWVSEFESDQRELKVQDENLFDEDPFLVKPAPQADGVEPMDDSKDEELPAFIPLDECILLKLMQAIKRDIDEGRPEIALQKFVQLKGRTSLTRQELFTKVPILFERKGPPMEVTDYLPLAVDFAGYTKQPASIPKLTPSYLKVLAACGLKVLYKEAVLSAIWDQRLFASDRSAGELYRPLNQQHNMYCSELVQMSADLVSHQLGQMDNQGEQLVAKIMATADKCRAQRAEAKQEQHQHKKPRLGSSTTVEAKPQTPSVAVAAAAAAASSTPPPEARSPEQPETTTVEDDDDQEYSPTRTPKQYDMLVADEKARDEQKERERAANRKWLDQWPNEPDADYDERVEAFPEELRKKREETDAALVDPEAFHADAGPARPSQQHNSSKTHKRKKDMN